MGSRLRQLSYHQPSLTVTSTLRPWRPVPSPSHQRLDHAAFVTEPLLTVTSVLPPLHLRPWKRVPSPSHSAARPRSHRTGTTYSGRTRPIPCPSSTTPHGRAARSVVLVGKSRDSRSAPRVVWRRESLGHASPLVPLPRGRAAAASGRSITTRHAHFLRPMRGFEAII